MGERTWDFDTYTWLEHYDQSMEGWERLCYRETLLRLPECAQAKQGEHVLDLGTGTGNSAVPFLELGCTVVGLDPSRRMLEQAQEKVERWPGRLEVRRVDDPFRNPPPGETFDIIVSAYAIHHLDDAAKREAARALKGALRPGGRIAIADTMFRNEDHKSESLQRHQDMEDEYQPTLDVFPSMFESEGMSVTLTRVGELIWILVAR